MATRDGSAVGGSGTGGPGIGVPKSESGAVGRASEDGDERHVDVEERLENVLRRLGLEGMKWVYFCHNYFRVLTF